MSRRWAVGVDIGGTSVVVGLVPAEGGPPRGLRTRATAGLGDHDAVIAALAHMVREAIEEGREDASDVVLGVGVGSPGPLDLAGGVVLDAFNLGWRDFPLRDRLAEAVGLPALLDNDANCATWGEYWLGAGRDVRNLVGVTLGTGIGGGVVLDGRLIHGASASAGELGHMTIDFHGRRCKCGNYGCMEAYASGPNIAARAREGLEAGAESALTRLVDGDLDRLTAATVYQAILEGDAYAEEVMLETAKILGAGLANIVNLFNPDMIVIVGGVTRAGEYLFAPLRSEVRRRAFRSAEQVCRIVAGGLPETAGVIGAAGLFLHSLGER
ncbi:MAG TPA: ROK family protein [Longimicrobiales bacterium]|nr:ROK family protein [Longimicrobiales bacterium]